MKEVDELKPNYAPVYAGALYPELAKIFQRHGYALAVHGSMARDFDLVAVPWAEHVSFPEDVLKEIEDGYVFRRVGEPTVKHHGRVAYMVSVGFGDCALDVSFFPVVTER